MTKKKPTGGPKTTAEEVAKALRESKGFVSVAARRLGVSEITVRNYMARSAECRLAREEAREEMKDYAEGRLFSRIQKDDTTAIIFFLKTQGKDRGYVERQELTGPGDEPVRIRLSWGEGLTSAGSGANDPHDNA